MLHSLLKPFITDPFQIKLPQRKKSNYALLCQGFLDFQKAEQTQEINLIQHLARSFASLTFLQLNADTKKGNYIYLNLTSTDRKIYVFILTWRAYISHSFYILKNPP